MHRVVGDQICFRSGFIQQSQNPQGEGAACHLQHLADRQGHAHLAYPGARRPPVSGGTSSKAAAKPEEEKEKKMSIKEAELFLCRGNSSSCFYLHRIHPGLQRKMDPCSREPRRRRGQSRGTSLPPLQFGGAPIFPETHLEEGSWNTTHWRPVALLRCR